VECIKCDFDNDGDVDGADLAIFASEFKKGRQKEEVV